MDPRSAEWYCDTDTNGNVIDKPMFDLSSKTIRTIVELVPHKLPVNQQLLKLLDWKN